MEVSAPLVFLVGGDGGGVAQSRRHVHLLPPPLLGWRFPFRRRHLRLRDAGPRSGYPSAVRCQAVPAAGPKDTPTGGDGWCTGLAVGSSLLRGPAFQWLARVPTTGGPRPQPTPLLPPFGAGRLDALTGAVLKDLCRALGLRLAGTKADQVQRLATWVHNPSEDGADGAWLESWLADPSREGLRSRRGAPSPVLRPTAASPMPTAFRAPLSAKGGRATACVPNRHLRWSPIRCTTAPRATSHPPSSQRPHHAPRP